MAKTTIPGEYLADGGITTAKIANDAVDADKSSYTTAITTAETYITDNS